MLGGSSIQRKLGRGVERRIGCRDLVHQGMDAKIVATAMAPAHVCGLRREQRREKEEGNRAGAARRALC